MDASTTRRPGWSNGTTIGATKLRNFPEKPTATVLVVDDDEMIMELEQAWLKAEGYEVLTARDGNQAMEILDRSPVDIVLADQVMPGLDGLSLLRVLRGPGRDRVPYFILITGDRDPRLFEQAFIEGADDFISKPMQRFELLARLRSARRVVDLARDLDRRADLSFEKRLLESGAAEFREVVATLAHDLRTPIATLRTTAETLSWNAETLPPGSARMVSRIAKLAIHLSETVRDITDAFVCDDSDGTTWTRFDLAAEARGAAELVRGSLRPGVELLSDPSSSCEISGNPHGIRRLCVNVLSNAVRATETGQVEIEALSDPNDPRWAVLRIRDTGGGIPTDILPFLGEPLALSSGGRRRKFSTNGAGLGLAICRRVATRHGGRIRIETAPDRGTTVDIRIRADLPEVSREFDFAPLDTVVLE